MAEAGKTLHLEVITPDAAVLHEDVDFVLVRALDGDLGIMPNHAPLIASLSIWPLCYDKGGKRQYVTVASGFLEVHDNTVTVITPASEKPEDIDVDRLAAHAADIDTTRAEAALQRALCRLDVAEKYGKQ